MSDGLSRRIVVVDDEPILRTLVSDRLKAIGFEAWPASDAFEAKSLVVLHDPDALVVDLDLGRGPNGIELILSLQKSNPHLGFVLMTNFTPSKWEMSSASNLSYVQKKDVSNFAILTEALEEVLLNLPTDRRSFNKLPASKLDKISKRQLETLALISQGLSNGEVASRLGVSVGAIEQTMKRIYAALGIVGTSGVSRRVVASGIYVKEMGQRKSVAN